MDVSPASSLKPLAADIAAGLKSGEPLSEAIAKEFPAFAQLRAAMLNKGVKPSDIVEAATEDRFINRGHDSSVFRIPKLAQHVWRRKNGAPNVPLENLTLEPVTDVAPGLNLGQAIAKIGGHGLVLKRVLGDPHGYSVFAGFKFTPQEIAAKHQLAIETAASMPPKAFSGMAKQLVRAEELELRFDPSNPHNVLVDKQRQKFNLVDFDPGAAYHSVSSMLHSLAYATPGSATGFVKSGLPDAYRMILDKALAGAKSSSLRLSSAFDLRPFLNSAKMSRAEAREMFGDYGVPQVDLL